MNLYQFSALCLQFFNKSSAFQTHFGFTNIGSGMLTFRDRANWKSKFWFGSPCSFALIEWGGFMLKHAKSVFSNDNCVVNAAHSSNTAENFFSLPIVSVAVHKYTFNFCSCVRQSMDQFSLNAHLFFTYFRLHFFTEILRFHWFHENFEFRTKKNRTARIYFHEKIKYHSIDELKIKMGTAICEIASFYSTFLCQFKISCVLPLNYLAEVGVDVQLVTFSLQTL